MDTRPPSGDKHLDKPKEVQTSSDEPTLFDVVPVSGIAIEQDDTDNGAGTATVHHLWATDHDVAGLDPEDAAVGEAKMPQPDIGDEDAEAGGADADVELSGAHEDGDGSEQASQADPAEIVHLNELSALYHVLERRLRGAAKGWPDHRRAELEDVLRDRFSDFFVDLPEDAIERLTEVALGNDPLHQAS